MPPSCDELLAQLDNFQQLVRQPLSQEQIASLEREIGIPAPKGVRSWLSKLGLHQEVGYANASDFEIHENPQELIESRRTILNLLGDHGADLFPFGHDVSGNEIAVRAGQEDDELVLVDHETRTAQFKGSFSQWVGEVVEEVIAHFESGGDVTEMFWCVQFSFEVASEKPIFDILEAIAPITARDAQREARPTGPNGIREERMGFAFLGQGRILSKCTCDLWAVPHFYFDYEEAASTPPRDSVIRRLDHLFRAQDSLKYKLVDYGLMEWPPAEETARSTAEPGKKKAWWKFW